MEKDKLAQKIEDEKGKPFRLVKYFTFSGLIMILFSTFAISAFNTHLAGKTILQKSEDYALLLIANLNHQVYKQFILPVAIRFGKIKLSDPVQFELMDKVVRSTLHSFKVDMVNFYDKNGTIAYSFDKEIIGKPDAGGLKYQGAMQGETSSSLEQVGNFWELLMGFPKKSRLITMAPIRAAKPLAGLSGPILGVVEIVQELSADYKSIFKFQLLIVLFITAVMTLIFVILRATVKNGEKIIEARTEERLRLKEQLSRAEHLSSLGEMIAGISHEIRNPLGIISSSASLLKKRMEKYEPANTIPEVIVEESKRLNNIITDFLNYAKPPKPKHAVCSVEKILERIFEFLRPELEKGDYDHKCVSSKDIPEFKGDPDMLFQAFLNILLNGMQAMPCGGYLLVETAYARERIIVSFKDEGGGVDDELSHKIWEPFFTTKETGTGLGLGIVKNIIEAHSGEISIENRKERGARVVVKLPVAG